LLQIGETYAADSPLYPLRQASNSMSFHSRPRGREGLAFHPFLLPWGHTSRGRRTRCRVDCYQLSTGSVGSVDEPVLRSSSYLYRSDINPRPCLCNYCYLIRYYNDDRRTVQL